MTPKTFAKAVAKTVVDDGIKAYKEIFADPGEVTDPYWKRVLELYESLSRSERKVILEIMRQVKIDTISEIFGILDGRCGLNGRAEDFELIHVTGRSRTRLNQDLQDFFLELME